MNQVKPKIVHIVQLHVLEYPHQDHVHPPSFNAHMSDLVFNTGFHM